MLERFKTAFWTILNISLKKINLDEGEVKGAGGGINPEIETYNVIQNQREYG